MPDFITFVPVASLVMATLAGASLLALYAALWMIERGVFRPYWLLPRREWATPVTSAFLHADFEHLLFNGFKFWAFGFSLERTMGSTTYVLPLLCKHRQVVGSLPPQEPCIESGATSIR
jgi:membrane associated rhomboid family serine protease